jgi:hypothetical protein
LRRRQAALGNLVDAITNKAATFKKAISAFVPDPDRFEPAPAVFTNQVVFPKTQLDIDRNR